MKVTDALGLVRFSHSVFALPFALFGAWIAADGPPRWTTLGLVVVCAVAARTAAMAFNRLVDRDVDAANPRTRAREIPTGKVSATQASMLIVLSSLAFVVGAFTLNRLAGVFAVPVLGVLFAYSWFKRFSWLAHLVLGIALALAPLGAWIAVRGSFEGDLRAPLLLAAAVATWVAGFDLIYACQDADFDRRSGLHSVPARFGLRAALVASALLHVVTVISLVGVGWLSGAGAAYWIALGAATALLVWEHTIVRPSDLSRVNMAFFTLNGWVGVGVFVGFAVDRSIAS